jgi:hypothetical protein
MLLLLSSASISNSPFPTYCLQVRPAEILPFLLGIALSCRPWSFLAAPLLPWRLPHAALPARIRRALDRRLAGDRAPGRRGRRRGRGRGRGERDGYGSARRRTRQRWRTRRGWRTTDDDGAGTEPGFNETNTALNPLIELACLF